MAGAPTTSGARPKIELSPAKKIAKGMRQKRARQSDQPQQLEIFPKQIAVRPQNQRRLVEKQPQFHQMGEDAVRGAAYRGPVGEAAKDQPARPASKWRSAAPER